MIDRSKGVAQLSKANPSAEVMTARIHELIETGKAKGVLTYKEIVEMLGDILAITDHCPNNDMALRAKMKESTIKLHCSAKVTKIDDNTITFMQDDQEITIPADTVIIASGYRSNNALANELKELIYDEDLYIVGDAVAPGKIIDSTRGAYQAMRLA